MITLWCWALRPNLHRLQKKIDRIISKRRLSLLGPTIKFGNDYFMVLGLTAQPTSTAKKIDRIISKRRLGLLGPTIKFRNDYFMVLGLTAQPTSTKSFHLGLVLSLRGTQCRSNPCHFLATMDCFANARNDKSV